MKVFIVLIGFILFSIGSAHAEGKTEVLKIKACADDKAMFPQAIFKGKNYYGMKFDVLNTAVKKLSERKNNKIILHVDIQTLPWKRCWEEAKRGEQDMVILAAYSKEREEAAFYPEGAASEKKPCESPTMALCDGYKILVLKDEPYLDYDKNPKTIPQPVRASLGYSVGDQIKKDGLILEESANNERAVLKLVRDKKGSAIVGSYNARYFTEVDPDTKQFVRILESPYLVKSYYYPISKKSKLTHEQMTLIWEALSSVGQDKNQIDQFLDRYYHDDFYKN